MCSRYWTLLAPITCPHCGQSDPEWDLQTHFMGDVGSCAHYYHLGEQVAELGAFSGMLGTGGDGEPFITDCAECGGFVDVAAEVRAGVVVRVWPEEGEERPC